MFKFNSARAASIAFALASLTLSGAAAAQLADPAGAAEPAPDPLAPLAAARPQEAAGNAVRDLTDWVIASGDNNGQPFIVIDKVMAKVFVFDSEDQFVGSTPALVGAAVGDESAPGIGHRKLSAISHGDRTTPAGRFVAKIGTETGNKEVLWVDYATSVSLHPVITTNRKERRLQRLQSPTPEDNRITFGCINVPASFYREVVRPLFKKTTGVVYILPETRPLREVFLAFHAPGRPSLPPEASR
jgi:hypothetical protein